MIENSVFVVCKGQLLGEALELALQKFDLHTRYIATSISELIGKDDLHDHDILVWLPDATEGEADLKVQLAAIRCLTEELPSSHIVVLGFGDCYGWFGEDLREAGAAALLPREIGTTTLVSAIELIGLGQKIFPAVDANSRQPVELAPPASDQAGSPEPDAMLARHAAPASVAPPERSMQSGRTTEEGQFSASVSLSGREKEILQMLVKGLSNKRIARQLDIAEATVKVHVKTLLRKTNVSNRTQAAVWGLAHSQDNGKIPYPM